MKADEKPGGTTNLAHQGWAGSGARDGRPQKLKLFLLIWGTERVLCGACLPGWFSPRASVSHCALIAPGHLSGQLGRQMPNTCLWATPWQLPHAVPLHTLGNQGGL